MTANIAAPIDPIATLWAIARAWLADAIAAFGGPDEIARTLVLRARGAIARRLWALETLVMKLLLVEAAKLQPLGAPSACAAPARSERGAVALAQNPDLTRPETWTVRFQLRIPPEAVAATVNPNGGPRIRDLGPARTVADIFAERARQAAHARMAALRAARFAPDEARDRARAEQLARRFEALRRTLADPLPRARRLKRKLLALKLRAYETAMRIALRLPPAGQPLNRAVFARADFEAGCAVPAAIAAPDSS